MTRSHLLDPEFPERLTLSGHIPICRFVQELIADYSQHSLSYPTDKIIAFSGIAERMQRALGTEVQHGIFDCLHRLLLWKRSDTKSGPIHYENSVVPSWSWMFYNGSIEFLTYSTLRVVENLSFESYLGIKIEVRQFERCCMNQTDNLTILADAGNVGFIYFDIDSTERNEFQNCVVIGIGADDHNDDPDKEYYILAVRKTAGEGEYERLGAGQVRARYISKSSAGKLL